MKKISLFIIASFLIITGCTPTKNIKYDKVSAKIDSKSWIKVLIKKTNSKVIIGSEKGLVVKDSAGKTLHRGVIYTIDTKLFSEPVKVESYRSPLDIGDARYRGRFLIKKIGSSIYVINEVLMDDYLCGVVPAEMSEKWPLEALKAQAIAARSYAYNHLQNNKNKIYDLDGTTKFQVYKGFDVESENSNKAVRTTSGVIMAYNSKPVMAFFHSTCGGIIINNKYVWKGNDIEYLQDGECEFCKNSPHYSWNQKMNIDTFRNHLRKAYSNVGDVKKISLKKHNGRIYECQISHTKGNLTMTGNDLRMILGARKIKSLYFKMQKVNNDIILKGHGYGHGVGLCQYGAKGMAEKKHNHREILKKYYNGVEIIKIR